MLSIGQRQLSKELVLEIVDAWLNATFEGEDALRRIRMLDSTN